MKPMTAALAAATLALASTSGHTCDDHRGECQIEDWRWNAMPGTGIVMLDGVATCNAGEIALRLYEGEGGKFLGATTAYIDKHIFQALLNGIQSPGDIAIKYSIEPGG